MIALSGSFPAHIPPRIAGRNIALLRAPLHAQTLDELYEKAKLEKSVALVAAGPSEPYEH